MILSEGRLTFWLASSTRLLAWSSSPWNTHGKMRTMASAQHFLTISNTSLYPDHLQPSVDAVHKFIMVDDKAI
jgi:hypothetical protein